jgi:hypothetical protein
MVQKIWTEKISRLRNRRKTHLFSLPDIKNLQKLEIGEKYDVFFCDSLDTD